MTSSETDWRACSMPNEMLRLTRARQLAREKYGWGEGLPVEIRLI